MRPFHWLWKPQRKSSPVAKPSRRGRHSGLPLERLEDRLAPANASIVDNTLTITFNDPSETVTVANGGTSLTLTGSAGINSTSKPSQAFFTADFNRIVVLDSVAGTGQTLNFGSGSILALTGGLDVTGVETVSFGFGINTSGGTAALSVVAPRTISVGAVTLTGGSGGVTLTAQGAIAANYSGVVINGSTITTAANGNVNISGTGGSGPSNNNVGVRLESNALVTSGGTGTVTVSGTGGSGTGTGHEGVVLFTGAQIRSGGAGTVSVTGTGGANSLGSAFGVRVNATTQISSGTGGNVIVQGTGGGGSGDYQIGVDVDSNAVITSGTGGTVSVTGTGGAGIGNFHYGVWVFDLSSRITSGGGAVSVTGTGTSTSEGVRLENTGGITSGSNAPITVTTDSLTIASGLINSGSGTTTVRTRSAGTLINLGGADVLIGIPLTLGLTATEINTITAGTLVIGRNDATASGAIAVSSSITPTGTTTLHLRTGSTVIASGLAGISETNLAITAGGNVSLTSTGTGTNVTNVSILSASGSITFTGDPDGFSVATVNGQSGVSASGDITLTTIGTNSDLTVTASNPVSSSTGNVALNAGRTVTLSANVSATGAGTLTVSGNSGAGARNILVNSGVQVISDFGLLTLDADQGSPVSGADVDGVLIDGGLVRSTGGSVTVQGRGFGPGAGVRVQNAGVIRAGGITTQATVVGNSGSGGTGTHGVVVIGSNSRITSDGGNVAVTGTSLGVLGGNSTAQQYGVLVHQSAGITAGGTGSITVSGTGGSAQGGENHGVNVTLGSAIASAGGPVNVSGTGGGGGPSFGVQVADGSVISAGGSASTTVVGLGGLSTSGGIGANGGSIGVRVFINARIGGNSSGAVEVTGTSRATGGNNANIGVLLDTSVIESSGGPVTVIGTSTQSNLGPDHGVAVFNTSTIGGGSGAVVIQGTTSSGLANSFGVSVGKNPGNNGDSAGTVSSTSSVLIEADRLDVTTVGTISAGTGSVTLRGRTAARPINLGGADGTDLGLTDAELDRVTAGTLVIGSATAGAVTVSAAITRPASTAVELRSGADLVISGGQLNTAGGTLFLSPGSTASVQPTLAGIDLTTGTTSFTSGADLAIQINGTTLDTQYTQLRVAGTVDLTGVDLILSGSYTSVADDSFVIVQATSRLGTFNGLPDGTTFTYRGRTLRIDYTATQVILTDLVPATLTATVDGSGNLTVTDVEPGGKHNVLKLERGLVGLVDSIILSDANERFASAPAGWTLSADRRSISTPATFTGTMTIDAAEGNDSLTIHHGGGDPLAGGVTYHGGAGGTDSLAFTGSLLASATLTHASTSAGSAVLDGQALSYTGLESPIAINTPGAAWALQYVTAAAPVTLAAAGADLQVTRTGAAGTVTLVPAGVASLTIRTGSGADSIELDSLPAGWSAALTLDGQGVADSLQVDTAAIVTTGSLTLLNIETVSLSQNISAASLSGSASTVNVAAPGQVQDGIDLAASGATVSIAAGTYAEAVSIAQNSLTLQGAAGGGTSLTGSIAATGTGTLTLTDLTFAGATLTSYATVNLASTASTAGTYTLNGATVSRATDQPTGTISLTSVTNVTISAGSGDDLFQVPAAASGPTYTLDGNTASNDSLTYDAGSLAVTATASSLAVAGGLTVQHQEIENVQVTNLAGFTLTGTGAADSVVVKRSGTADLQYQLNGGPWIVLVAPTAFAFLGGAGADSLTVDFSAGLFTQPVSFQGDDPTSGPGDQLLVSGGSFATITSTYTDASSGNINFSSGPLVSYTGLEPVLLQVGSVTDLIFNLPATGSSATLEDDGTLSNGQLRLRSTDAPTTFETTTFTAPTGSLSLRRGNATDTLTVSSISDLPSGAALNLGTLANPLASVSLQGAISVASLTIAAGTLTNTAAADVTVAGNASLTGGTSINLGNAASDNFQFGTLTFTASGTVSIAEDNAMVLAGASSAAQVTLASPAGISDGSTGTLAVSGLLTLSAGASDIVLDNANDFAQIAFTGNHVTLNDTAAGLSFAASSASGNLIVTATGALTQSGPLTVTGTTSLTVGSANNITLNNPGNDFGGAVSIVSANAVSLTDQNALILGASTISGTLAVTAGGTLTDAGAVTVAGLATLSASGQSILLDEPGTDFTSILLTAASAELRDTAGGLIHAGGNVSGALLLLTTGGLTQTAAVTAGSLGVRNTGTGAIDLSTSSNAIGTFAAANTVSGGAILVQFDASTRSIGTVSAGTLFPATAGLTTANGPITVSSGTTLNLGANLTSTGGGITFTTQAASLTLTANVTLDSAGGSIQVNRPINSATLDTHTLTLTAGAGNIQLGNVGASTRPLGVLVTSANNVSGTAISVGSGGITQASGTGTTTFSGLLRAFNGGSISLTGTAFSLHSLQVASAGTIDIAHAGASSLTVSNTTTLGASGVLTVNATTAATTGSIAGTITGTGAAALVKVGPGTLTLSGNNTYLGQTSINAGVLTISSATALGTTASPTVVASGAALALDPTASITVAEPIRLNGIGVSGIGALVNLGQNNFLTGGVTLLASSAIGVSGGTLTVQTTGVTDGAGSFTLSKVGAGTLRISAPGTYDGGSTISAGTLALGASDVLPAGTVTVDATLDLAGFAEGITLLAGSGIITTSAGPATLTVDAGSFAGTIQNTVALTKATSGTLVLSGANTYTGATSIQAGLLRAGASNTFSTDSAVSLANVAGATLDLDGFNNTIPSLAGGGATGGQVTLGGALLTIDGSDFTTFAGTISGNGQLTVSGTTTLELTSANNYTGTTTIHAGATLVVSGSITSPVSHAGILAGSGSITGDVASTGAGAVLPGNGIGVLTVTGNFAASTTFEIAAPYLLAGTDYDRLVVQGATNTINLSAATVSFTSVGGGTAPVLPTFLTLIVNDTTNPIVPFSNLPEGGLVTLGLGGAARTFIASYLGGDGNDLVLYNADAPSTVYVRSSFTGGFGQLIADADLGTTGAQPALVGLTAFATLADALAAVALNGTVVVNAGTYPENVTLTGASRTLRIGGPDAPQSVTVQALTVSAAESLALAGASSLTFGTASSTSIAGTLAGTGTLIKQGAGVVSLSGSNTAFTGKIQLLGGALSISDDANLGAVPDSLVADLLTIDGGTLLFTGSADITLAATRGITLGSGGATLDSSALATNLNAILQGPLSGAGDLTLVSHGSTADQGAPAGSLRLASLASSFLGTVTVSAGVVSFAGDASFGDATNPIHLGTTAARAGLFATSSVSLPASRSIILVGGGERVLRTLAGATFTVASTLSGAGPLILTDAGTLALAGSNSYTGYTYLAGGGTLQLAASDVVPDGSDVLQGPGSTFDLAGQTEVVRGIFVTSAADTTPTLQLGTGGSLTLLANTFAAGSTPTNAGASYSARIRGAGSITYAHATSDTVAWDILNPANDFVGTWTVTRGRLRFGSDGAVGDADNDIVLNGAPVIGFTDQTGTASLQPAQAGPFTLGPGHALVLPAGKQGTLLAFGSDTLIVQGNLTGAGQLRKEGVGAVELHGSASTYAGDTIIVAGTLRAGGTNTLSPSSSVVLNPTTPATLDLAGFDNTIHLLSGGGGTNGNVLLGAGTLTTGGTGDSTYAGILSGTGGLIKRGAGTLILTGASTYTGPTTVRAGTLQLGDAGTTGSLNAASTVTLGDAATGASPVTFLVHRSDASTHANPIVVSSLGSGTATVGTLDTTGGGTSTTFTGSVTLHRSTSFLSLDLDGQVFSNSITGSVGTLTVTGGGRTILQASNSFVGNVAVTGAGTILRLASTGDQIPNASSVDLAAGTLLELHGDGETINALTGSGSVQNSSGSNNLSVGAADGAGTFQGNLNDGAGLLAFVKLGTGTQILAGAGNATGGVTVSGGTLRLEGARSLDEGYFPGIDGVVYTVQTGATLTLAGDWISRSSSIYRIHGGELQTLAPGGDLLYLNQVEFDVAPGLLSGTSGFRTGRFANPVFQVTAAASGSVITAPVSLDDSPTTTHLALDVADGAASDDLLISSVISDVSGAAGLAVHKLGAGLLRLTGSSTYTGATRFEAGIVAVPTLAPAGSPSPLGATAGTSDLLVFNGGVLRYTGTSVSGINRTFTILAGGGTLDVTQPGTTLELSDASGVGASTGTGGGLLTLTGAGSGTLNQVLDAGLTGGLTKTGNGTWTLGRTNLYTGLTTISTGRLHVDGSIIGNVTIASGAFLGGSGTVGGSVSGAGSIAPGSSPGILTVGALASVGSVVVELNGLTVGTQYDQLQVNGAVNLTGTTLTLALGIAPTVGQQFTVLARNAVGPITGTFVGLAEGATFTVSSTTFQITYQGGDGNDVVLTVVAPAAPTLQGTPGDDTWLVIRNGAHLEVHLNGNLVYSALYASITGGLTIDGLDGSDSLTVDFLQGNAIPAGNIAFEGGSGASDTLTLTHGTTATVTHTFLSPSSGSVTLAGALTGVVSYTGLEPVFDYLVAAGRIFDFLGAAETITLTDSGAADGQMTIDSTLGEAVTFANPTTTLTLQTGNGSGVDALDLDGFDSALGASLVVTAPDDSVSFHAAFTFAAGRTVTVDADAISIDAAIATTGSGSIDLEATTVTVLATGSLTTASGSLQVQANQVTLIAGSALSAAASITLQADSLAVAGTVTAPGQRVLVQPRTSGTLIDLGGSDVVGTLGLTDAELDRFQAGVLQIGSATAGAITLSAAISPANTASLHLMTASTVGANASGALATTALAITAPSGVALDVSSNAVGTLAILSAGAVAFRADSGLTVGTVDGVAGLHGSSVSLTVPSGLLTVQDTAATHDVESTSGSITLTADAMALQGSITTLAGGQSVTLRPFTAGQAITLGSDVSGTLSLDDIEIDHISTARLEIGSASAGAITVTAAIDVTDAPTIATLRLNSGAGVTASAAGITAQGLAIAATGAVSFTAGSTDVATLAIQTSGAVTFVDATGLTIGTVDGLHGVSGSSVALTAMAGSLTVQNTAASPDVLATAGALSLRADDIDLQGTLSAGSQTVTLVPLTSGRGITLGGEVGGTLSLTDAELDAITAGRLIVGDASTGALSVVADINLTDGPVIPVLRLNAASVTATTGGVIVASLALQTGAVTVTTSSTNVGTVAISATGAIDFHDADTLTLGTVDGLAGVDSSSVVAITSAGLLTLGSGAGEDLQAATADLHAAGLTQLAGSIVNAAQLRLRGTGLFTLNQPNTVGTLAASINGALTYQDVDALTIGTVVGTAGISTSDDAVTLTTGGLLTLGSGAGEDVSLGNATLDLFTAGATQASGSIVSATALRLRGTGVYALTQGNLVDVLACQFVGSLDFANLQSLTVGTVLGTVGITSGTAITNGGSVVISCPAQIVVDASIDTSAGTGGTTSISGDVVVNAFLTPGAGDIILNGATGTNVDLIIDVPLSSPTDIILSAPRDIIIRAPMSTTPGSGASIFLTAGTSYIGPRAGGIWVDATNGYTGSLNSDGAIVLRGKDLQATFTPTTDAIRLEGTVTANTGITFHTGTNAPAGAGTYLGTSVLNTGAGDITFNHPVLLTASASVTASNGNVHFNGPLDGAQNLTLAAPAGTITFAGAVGGTTSVGSGVGPALTLQAGSVEFQGTVRVASGIQASAGVPVVFRQDVEVGPGNTASSFGAGVTLDGLSYRSAVGSTFSSALNLSGGAVEVITTAGAAWSVQGPLQGGGQDLTLNVAGPASFQGAASNLGDGTGAALTIQGAGTTTFHSTLQTSSGIRQTAGAGEVIFRGDVTISGAGDTASDFAESVTLGGLLFTSNQDVTFGSSASDLLRLADSDVRITLSGGKNLVVLATVSGDRDLTLDVSGSTRFAAPVGSPMPLGDGTGHALTLIGAGATTFESTLTVNSGLDQDALAGRVTFQADVTVQNGSTDSFFNGNVTLDGLTYLTARNITFGDAASDSVTLSGAAVTLQTSLAGRSLLFRSQLTGDQNLVLTVPTGTVSVLHASNNHTGATTLNAPGTTMTLASGAAFLDVAGAATAGEVILDAANLLLQGPGAIYRQVRLTDSADGSQLRQLVVANAGGTGVQIDPGTQAVQIGATGAGVLVQNSLVGLNLGDDLDPPTRAILPTSATIAASSFLDNSLTGVRVANATLTVAPNNLISAATGTNGLVLTGPSALISSLSLGNLSLQGYSGAGESYIRLEQQALAGPRNLDASAVRFDGLTGASMSAAGLANLEKNLVHYPDDAGVGLIVLRSNYVVLDDGNLLIVGSDQINNIRVDTVVRTDVKVSLNSVLVSNPLDPLGRWDVSAPGKRVIIFAQGGDDAVQVTGSLSSEQHGGLGNDRLTGGAGTDILDGEAGIDTLVGMDGHDVLIGGLGRDTLQAGNGNDLLIGGQINPIAEQAAYAYLRDTALAGWLASPSQAVLDALWATGSLDGTSINEYDVLSGGLGTDGFIAHYSGAGILDLLSDFTLAQGDKRKNV